MVKFADDVTILAPESTDSDIAVELNHVKEWALANRMVINLSKTKELVFQRPRPSQVILLPCLIGIERITIAKLLGVHIDSHFSFIYTTSVFSKGVCFAYVATKGFAISLA